jgi:hypothetical protein
MASSIVRCSEKYNSLTCPDRVGHRYSVVGREVGRSGLNQILKDFIYLDKKFHLCYMQCENKDLNKKRYDYIEKII